MCIVYTQTDPLEQ